MPNPPRDASAIDEITRRLRQGEDVLGEWYAREYPHVHRLAAGFTGDASRADDLAADAMFHLLDHLPDWDPARPYGPWRTRVVLNLAREAQRSRDRRTHHEEAAGARWHARALPDPGEDAAARDVRRVLEDSLASLPDREREVFVLVDLEGSTPSEAAELLGIAGSTVRAALSLARRRLRARLAPRLGHEGPLGAGGPA